MKVESIRSNELDSALAYLLASESDGALATEGRIAGFRWYLAHATVGREAWRVGPSHRPRALFLALLLPGRTALVMVPSPRVRGIDFEEQTRLVEEGLRRLAIRPLHYVQALVDPQAQEQRAILERTGFRLLTPLRYLEREVLYPWVEPPASSDAEWVAYRQALEPDFAAVISETYQNSRDCPELSGLRPIEDILEAHRGVGPFEPALWELARIEGRYAGCILLARIAGGTALEIVYVGVVPEARRRGVATLLLRRAFEHGRAQHARRMTVVVDARNEPACRLYDRFCFMTVAQREAYLYRWPPRLTAQRAGRTDAAQQ